MADDRMKNDDLQRNMGNRGEEGENLGQQSPGRSGQQGGHQAGGHGGTQQGGYGGGQNARDMEEDDDLGAGGAGKGSQNRGGQNR